MKDSYRPEVQTLPIHNASHPFGYTPLYTIPVAIAQGLISIVERVYKIAQILILHCIRI